SGGMHGLRRARCPHRYLFLVFPFLGGLLGGPRRHRWIRLEILVRTHPRRSGEYAVPIVATRVMLWDASMAGGVLMAISVAVLCNQLVLMRVQSWTDEHGRVKVADCSIMFFGLAGLATTFVFTSVLWFLTVGWGATAPASARSHWLLVMGPIVLSEAWFPYLGNGVNMTFTRLVLTHVPARTSGHKRWHEHECSEVRA
ncbi:unnamed protein product, partial [Prorocentrum cordatum]